MQYPQPLVPPGGIAPSPRRVRGLLGSSVIVDTRRAVYVWEFPPYPQYYLPLDDVDVGALVDDGTTEATERGPARLHSLRIGAYERVGAARVFGDDAPEPLRQTVRIDFDALDAWFEEDEQIYVHPRNPYARVDALPSSTALRVELEGVVLAEAPAHVRVFETGLPPRHYLPRSALRLEHLIPSDTVTSCPYKGTTSQYWSVAVGSTVHADLAWEYAFPTAPLLPIAGHVAFFDEKVDTFLDGHLQPRPTSPFG